MLYTVTCTGCGTDFPVDPRKVPDEGVYAQCSACPQIFFVDQAALLAADPPSVTVHPPAAVSVAPEPEAESEPLPSQAEPIAPEVSTSTLPEAPVLAEAPEPTVPDAAPEWQPPAEPVAATAPPEAAQAAQPQAEPGGVATAPRTFGRRDPHERATRLARVLVSDMIAYHPDRHSQSLQNQTLAADFEEEIEKSWNEYVQQVGKDIAESTSYWKDALNQVLARGQQLF